MTETTAALCAKPLIGVLMWIGSLCASNQLLGDATVSLSLPGEVLAREVLVPMNERYRLTASFRYADRAAYDAPSAAGGVAHASHPACKSAQQYDALGEVERAALGAQIALRVTIAEPSGKVVSRTTFASRCVQSWGHLTKSREFGWIDLKKGRYVVSVENLVGVPASGETVTLSLTGAGAGYP